MTALQKIVCIGIGSLALQAFAGPESPEETIQNFHGRLKALEFDDRQRIRNDTARKEVNDFLDLESMAREALRNHWTEAPPEQRERFISLLWQLVESTAYPDSRQLLLRGNVLCEKDETEGAEVWIHCAIQEEGEILETSLAYNLGRVEAGWVIQDIILDEISIITDLRYQFEAIIEEEGFEGLLLRMEERLRSG